MILPPVRPFEFPLFLAADSMRYGIVALTVLYVPSTSMSITALKPLLVRPEIGATKLPAAPALRESGQLKYLITKLVGCSYMTKSMAPSSLTHLSAALVRLSGYLGVSM